MMNIELKSECDQLQERLKEMEQANHEKSAEIDDFQHQVITASEGGYSINSL